MVAPGRKLRGHLLTMAFREYQSDDRYDPGTMLKLILLEFAVCMIFFYIGGLTK